MLKLQSFILFFILVSFLSCDAFNKNMVLDYFDPNDKSITVSSGTDPLILGIKELFLKDSWGVTTYTSEINLESISLSSFDTRYLMVSDYVEGEDIILGNFVREYTFTIYDTNSYSEVIILYGKKRTLEQVLSEFESLLEVNYE
ncbi:hypothetical protein EW093_05640 [Thiospirochaeta perfilievii]|uniref:Uncharacterized protein n=1 Tax=Thiospirochaeta perfilievii TaxID=252967 RepID=A0A5C1QA40_9SPIO|nr:hypothetical protein [Thiospirochaeta perfilievii]QEN04208.1 hypothetical protein EW093_05640 [Thiospirochaeta perfilievii]